MDKERRIRIVFMGTPLFAKIILEALYDNKNFEICAVFAQPDKRSGRGLKKVEFCEVKSYALEHNLLLKQPQTLKDEEVFQEINELSPDFIVVAAYGKILPEKIIKIPKYDCINVHGSLLPAYRGAAPIQRAIMDSWKGVNETGVSIMRVTPELDAGPVYSHKELEIGAHSSETLSITMAKIGAELLISTLLYIIEYNLQPVEQEHGKATFAPKLQKSDGFINCSHSLKQIEACVRAITPWPGARIQLLLPNTNKKTILEISICGSENILSNKQLIGQVFFENKCLKIYCKDGCLIVDRVKPEGKRWMSALDYFNGKSFDGSRNLGKVVFE
ncbi:MAG: methionyl-tRNA formyltransferase [Desulfovibrio sp.]|nr:methionyl-tRNA formyltransferase [Desulfovibrio sp.]